MNHPMLPTTPSSPPSTTPRWFWMYCLYSFGWTDGHTSRVASRSPCASAGNWGNSSILTSSTVHPNCSCITAFATAAFASAPTQALTAIEIGSLPHWATLAPPPPACPPAFFPPVPAHARPPSESDPDRPPQGAWG